MDIMPLGSIYQFKIILEEVYPPIWRRFRVVSDIELKAHARSITR